MSSCCYGARSGKTKKATERTKENQCLSFSYLQEAETALRGQSTNITQPPGSVQGRVRRRRGDWNHHNLEKLSWLLRSKFVKCFIQTSRHQLQSPHFGLILQELKRPKWHDPTTAPAPSWSAPCRYKHRAWCWREQPGPIQQWDATRLHRGSRLPTAL